MRTAILLLALGLLVPAASWAAVTEVGGDFTIWGSTPGLDFDAYEPASAVNEGAGEYLLLWSEDEQAMIAMRGTSGR